LGNLTIDSGHEMYVPAMLAEGKVLYRDVWFMYGPVAPYLNSYLFRFFGLHLNVLIWPAWFPRLAPAFSSTLWECGCLPGWRDWTAGAVVLIQAFHPSLFCFPLPYSFSSVYGCLVACFFLWLVVMASTSRIWGWIFGAGMAAAMALLLKLEFGAACYGTLLLLIGRAQFSAAYWKSIPRDLLAILPGMLICGAMVAGCFHCGHRLPSFRKISELADVLFHEDVREILAGFHGISITGDALADAARRTFTLLGVAQGSTCLRRGGPCATPSKVNVRLAASASASPVMLNPVEASQNFRTSSLK